MKNFKNFFYLNVFFLLSTFTNENKDSKVETEVKDLKKDSKVETKKTVDEKSKIDIFVLNEKENFRKKNEEESNRKIKFVFELQTKKLEEKKAELELRKEKSNDEKQKAKIDKEIKNLNDKIKNLNDSKDIILSDKESKVKSIENFISEKENEKKELENKIKSEKDDNLKKEYEKSIQEIDLVIKKNSNDLSLLKSKFRAFKVLFNTYFIEAKYSFSIEKKKLIRNFLIGSFAVYGFYKTVKTLLNFFSVSEEEESNLF